jgi:PleD family two-component response regulator
MILKVSLIDNCLLSQANCIGIKITLSIGVTTDLCPYLDDMIVAADYLLYRAKHKGRNCVVAK